MTATRIKLAALPLFSQKGYEGTALSEIAEKVGIKKPSIYAHYKNKEALFWAVVADMTTAYVERWDAVINRNRALCVEQQLYGLLEETTRHFTEEPLHIALWIRIWLFPPAALKEELLQRMMDLHKRLEQDVTKMIQKGIAQGEIRAGSPYDMAFAFLSLMDGYLMRINCYGPGNYATQPIDIWNCFWPGIRKQRQQE
ncbi:MAG: TetR/AcrR family transcriptional regulator [Firmicutes bacterium]|nr:TetR/AcrR family transcriptional regulator [Bacillota bacterium]